MAMDFSPKFICWLIPDEISPCDLFFHFKGQYASVVSSGNPITLDFLQKISRAGFLHVYIKSTDNPAWDSWTKQRVVAAKDPEKQTPTREKPSASELYGNKRAEFISYMLKSLNPKDQGAEDVNKAIQEAKVLVEGVVKLSSLDWYFQKFHEPPDLFHHNARVAFLVAFIAKFFKLIEAKELEDLVCSIIIHEIEGDPATNMKTIVSEQTINYLKKKSYPVSEEVIRLIRLHDELYSGKGFPSNKKGDEIPIGIRLFNLANHFDHYKLAATTPTRKAKLEHAKKNMEARQADYDPKLSKLFWFVLEKHIEVVT